MIQPWLNLTVTVQRRPSNPARNSLNEPNYGAESGYPVVYTNMPTRIEYPGEKMQFTETGERVALPEGVFGVEMFIDPSYTVLPEDRVTVTGSDDASLLNQRYIVMSVIPQWDSVGNMSHAIATLQIH